jgi:cellulose synthase/poly-beta-1,6-N-acetylglucosamine synthase-like glycosyltransferase
MCYCCTSFQKGTVINMEYLGAIAIILATLTKAFTAYFVAVGLFTLKRRRARKTSPPSARFAILIPARNEQSVIAEIVESLKNQNYPADLRDIYVIPNNCSDNTERTARNAGAYILKCRGPVRNKGDVLHEAIDQLMRSARKYDAFCVFDADNLVHPDFLAWTNTAFSEGARVTKSANSVKNPYSSATAGCYAAWFAMYNTFFSRPRAALGLSSKFNGTGFAFRREIMEKYGGWTMRDIAEDAQFAVECALQGERIDYVPEAITYDEAPENFYVSLVQRRRWCSGVMEQFRKAVPRVFRAVTHRDAPLPKGSERLVFDMIATLTVPALQAISPVPLMLAVMGALAADEMTLFGISFLASIALWLAGTILVAVILLFIGGYRDLRAWKTVLFFPIFMISWLPLQVAALVTTHQPAWKQIRHGADTSNRAA